MKNRNQENKNIKKMKNTINIERARRRMSQKQLAEELGVAPNTIHKIETNRSDPKVGLALRIARFFGLKVDDIFKG